MIFFFFKNHFTDETKSKKLIICWRSLASDRIILTSKSYCINSKEHSLSLEYIFLEKHKDLVYVHAYVFVCIHMESYMYTLMVTENSFSM